MIFRVRYNKKNIKVMTKKEAYEHVLCTKVLAKTEEEQVKLQEFLFSIGCTWQGSNSTEIMKLCNCERMFFINACGSVSHGGYNSAEEKAFCDSHIFKRVRLEALLAIEIEKDWKDIFKDVRDSLEDKQIMVISKDRVMIIDL